MGETRDHLEENGGPGRVLCKHMGRWLIGRCTDGNALHPCVHYGECPEWTPDDEEDGPAQ